MCVSSQYVCKNCMRYHLPNVIVALVILCSYTCVHVYVCMYTNSYEALDSDEESGESAAEVQFTYVYTRVHTCTRYKQAIATPKAVSEKN